MKSKPPVRMPRADLRKADGHTGAWSSMGRQVGETDIAIIQQVFKVRGEDGEGGFTQGASLERCQSD